MSTPALLQLPDFSGAPKNQVGTLAVHFARLFEYGLPLPPMLALPADLLIYIAETNALLESVRASVQKKPTTSQFLEHLSLLIRKQKIPSTIATPLARQYQDCCRGGFVSIFTSPTQPGVPHLTSENIKGEATLQEAVLELWAQAVVQTVARTPKTALTLEKLIPTALLIQHQPNATVSGTGFTRHPITGDRSTLLIQSVWGAQTTPLPTGEGDSFEVDAQTYQETRRTIRKQATERHPVLGGFASQAIPEKRLATPTLTPKQLTRVARLLWQVRQKSLHHYRVCWMLENETLYCLSCSELDPATTHPATSTKTTTKLYTTIHSIRALSPEMLAHLDGIGALRLEYTYAQFGMHPLAALETTYKRLLAKELTQTIEKTIEHSGSLPLTIRSQSFTSAELQTLSRATRFEPTEPNPYLGLRGGLKALSQPNWLKFELEVIQKIQAKTPTELSILLPFVRTPTELARLARTVEEYLPATAKRKPLWLELATPATIFTLAEFPLQAVGGLVIRFEQISALFVGYDPTNPEVSTSYPTTLAHLELVLQQVTAQLTQAVASQELTTPPVLRLQLDTYNPQYVDRAVQFGLEGVIVQPKTLVLAKNSILETEARSLQKK